MQAEKKYPRSIVMVLLLSQKSLRNSENKFLK